jgi:hypothetical protein
VRGLIALYISKYIDLSSVDRGYRFSEWIIQGKQENPPGPCDDQTGLEGVIGITISYPY